MSFLPQNYEPPATGNYMKLQDGKNRIRILGQAIVGNVFWTTNGDSRKPVRRRMGEVINQHELGTDNHGEPERVKHFWAFPVWNYAAKQVQILELTQSTVQGAIRVLVDDVEWGDPTEYDLTIARSGSSLDTKYSVTPSPKRPLDAEALAEWRSVSINLDALYEGGDPFAGGGAQSEADAPQAGTIDTVIKSVETKVPGKVWAITTDAGRFGVTDGGLASSASRLQGTAVRIKWTEDKRGKRADSIAELNQPAAVGGGGSSDEEDTIPFAHDFSACMV